MVQNTKDIKSGEETQDPFIDADQLQKLYDRIKNEPSIFERFTLRRKLNETTYPSN